MDPSCDTQKIPGYLWPSPADYEWLFRAPVADLQRAVQLQRDRIVWTLRNASEIPTIAVKEEVERREANITELQEEIARREGGIGA